MDSGGGTRALPRVSFLIRRSPDQRLVSTSPRLIAAAHVLLRLLAPRHPPCALILLIRKNTCVSLWSFQGAHGPRCPPIGEGRARSQPAPVLAGIVRGLSKLNSVTRAAHRSALRDEVDIVLGESDELDGDLLPSTGPMPSGVIAPVFPRKEVIQPQLPLRLPCYDFTPIADPTFDGSLPCGLGHRLRVLLTPVV